VRTQPAFVEEIANSPMTPTNYRVKSRLTFYSQIAQSVCILALDSDQAVEGLFAPRLEIARPSVLSSHALRIEKLESVIETPRLHSDHNVADNHP
jgi:hypothetical protein